MAAPAAASRRQAARPMPRDPPVTRATLPVSVASVMPLLALQERSQIFAGSRAFHESVGAPHPGKMDRERNFDRESDMTRIGYKLMTEEHGPSRLVANAVRAEELGFDFLGISDHFSPWLDEEGHSPFAWSVLGAIALATRRVDLMTSVTCPYLRYHPAIVAQAAATIALLSNGRFTLGLGSGELLNEHVTGEPWPRVAVRHEMLAEAVDIIRLLFEGGEQSYTGRYLELASGRLFDRPATPPPIAVAAGGEQAAALAARCGGGLIGVEAKSDLVKAYRDAGGEGPTYAECGVCWASSERKALETVHRYQRWGVLGWSVLAELPGPRSFAEATAKMKPEQLRGEIPCGPDPEPFLEAIDEFVDAGFENILLTQVGPDQDGFFEFFQKELAPELRSRTKGEKRGKREPVVAG
jgi:G6PDH family F420-dependent oxidoreductase